MDFELWTIDSSKSSNLQTTAGGPNDEQAELQQKELEAEDLWPVLNEEDKKREKQMGDNKEFEVKAQTRKQGGNGTIQQMATESRSGQKKQKIKNVRNGSLDIYNQWQIKLLVGFCPSTVCRHLRESSKSEKD